MIDQTTLAELAAFVEGCDFPCSKEDLIDQAEERNVTDDVMQLLDQLPDREYLSETDIVEAVQSESQAGD